MDNEIILFDRLAVIREADKKWDLRSNAYLSFSGGKDSTILHYLLDEALPGNEIPRVFVDTGIEYVAIRKFVLDLKEQDPRFEIVKPSRPIRQILETYGYPFKSKEHSMKVGDYQKGLRGDYVLKYKAGGHFGCPKELLYQFDEGFKLKLSNKCCLYLKKKPVKNWEKINHRPIVITGMRKEEGGQRANLGGCVLTDKSGQLKKFHPLLVVSDKWEEWFSAERGIRFCGLYYPPFNFKRTGCKGCPFALTLQEQLAAMSLYLPAERAQCEIIWAKVYAEYRRIGYRLKKTEQIKLF